MVIHLTNSPESGVAESEGVNILNHGRCLPVSFLKELFLSTIVLRSRTSPGTAVAHNVSPSLRRSAPWR